MLIELSSQLIICAPQTASDDETARATLLGALIAGATALVATLLTVVIQRHAVRRSEQLSRSDQRIRRNEQQLDELYGPLILLRRQSQYLWQKLREGKSDPDWRLLNHITEVKADPAENAMAEELIRLNTLTQELILRHPALVYGQRLPDSFHRFLAHAGVVKVAFEMGRVPGLGQFIYYPDEFDQDLETAYTALLEIRAKELGSEA